MGSYRGGGTPCRRLCSHHRCQSLSPELARKMGKVTLKICPHDDIASGADATCGMREGFDVGLEMSGNPSAFRDTLNNMCHGGKIAMLGLPSAEIATDWNTVIFNMLTIRCGNLGGWRDV
ncbi:MAG: zinc-binding dehydrogenase [Caldilineaceae bacterium]